jgi:hypothetical protein
MILPQSSAFHYLARTTQATQVGEQALADLRDLNDAKMLLKEQLEESHLLIKRLRQEVGLWKRKHREETGLNQKLMDVRECRTLY